MSLERAVRTVHGMRALCWAILAVTAACAAVPTTADIRPAKPNVILVMADDLGWGDVGFNGGQDIATPHLDAMAVSGLVFDRFYAGAPVCSPTRGSCLTGRHPFRYGVRGANQGQMLTEEHTLAEILGAHGYTTGLFGKWHLGTLTKTVVESNRGGPRGTAHYAPPWEHGFDVCFATEAKVPTWDPMKQPGSDEPYGTHYWTGPGERVTDNLDGDDSRVIVDRALPFVRDAAQSGTPFLAVIWLHAPHLPVVAGPEDLALYPDGDRLTRHYRGTVTALDRQVGRIRDSLRALGIAENTMLWFCSDNGPEGKVGPGSAGPLRGRKRALYEGGLRVPAVLEWPGTVAAARTTFPAFTSDYLPTILSALGLNPPDRHPLEARPLDGQDISRTWTQGETLRSAGMGFEYRQRAAWIEDRFKIVAKLVKGEIAQVELYDLQLDPREEHDIAAQHASRVAAMRRALEAWRASCAASAEGADYE